MRPENARLYIRATSRRTSLASSGIAGYWVQIRKLGAPSGRNPARHLEEFGRRVCFTHTSLAVYHHPLPTSYKMALISVKIKHAGKVHDVELDTDLPPGAFKEAIYQKTGVPPERMKVMIKGGMLKVRRTIYALRTACLC